MFMLFLFLYTHSQVRFLEGFQVNMCIIYMKFGSLIFSIVILRDDYNSDLSKRTN